MQDVNDDMDELFRKAAEDYPLRIDGENWDDVLAGLQPDATPLPPLTNEKGKRRRVLWLLLLLPLGLLCTTLYYSSETKHQQTEKLRTERNKITTGKTNKTEEKQRANLPVQNKQNFTVGKANNQLKKWDANGNKVLNKTGIAIIKKIKKEEISANNLQLSSVKERNKNQELNDEASSKISLSKNKNNTIAKQPDEPAQRIESVTEKQNKTEVTAKEKSDTTDTAGINKTDSATVKNGKKTYKKIKNKTQPQHGFYAGFLASFDVSTVKLQKIEKAGYSLNVLAGYRFSKRLSVESGVNWTSKKYYSIGEYFDKSRTGIPLESKIIYTNGSCNMFEIPVAVKYDFARTAKRNLFVTAGLSSYIMKEESYNYYADHNGVYYDANRKYKNAGNNWFSVADISVGYQLYLNKLTTLRIEPYIKMPLAGIGIAKMPITSTGISVGFTRSF